MNADRPRNAFAEVWRNPYLRAAVFLLLLYLLYRLVGRVSEVVTLALIAYIIAYLANPLLNWLQRRRIPRGVGILLVILLLLGLVAVASSLVFVVANQFLSLANQVPDLAARATIWVNGLFTQYGDNSFVKSFREQITSLTQNGAATLTRSVGPFLERLVSYNGVLFGSLVSVANVLAQSVAILILSIYMMSDFERIGLTLLRIFPRAWQPFVLDLSRNVEHAVGGYLRGQILIAAIVGTLIGLGLAIIGLPSALAIGFLAGITNIVPYLGVIIAITPALLLALPLGWVKVLLVVGVFVLANQLEGHVFSPLILGRSTDLHPVTVVLAILAGLTLAGIVGALVAVPLAALGKVLLHEYYYPSRVYKDGP